MSFSQKADYPGPSDRSGQILLDYGGRIGPQRNPIAIAQYGLGNYNLWIKESSSNRRTRFLRAADGLVDSLERTGPTIGVWYHFFDWEYRDTLKAPWFSGLAQGQGVSLLLRAHSETSDDRYSEAAGRAFETMRTPVVEGGVLFRDSRGHDWIEEYIVDPPTHILNGFIWALWGVHDYYLYTNDSVAKLLFDRCVDTLRENLPRYDIGYWSLYEQSGTRLRMVASPFYHRLHIVQLKVMERLTCDPIFGFYADKWDRYLASKRNQRRALLNKALFKLLYY